MDETKVRHHAKRIIDLGELGIEMGELFNPIGNFSLLPLDDGNWLACFRRFQYYIEGDRYSYFSSPNMFYKDRHYHVFAILDKEFNLVRRIDNSTSTYYETEEWKTQYDYGGKSPFLEDARFTRWGNDIYLTSSIYYWENDKKKWATEVQLLDIHADHIDAHHFWNTLEHGMRGNEKNWMSVPDKPMTFITVTSNGGAKTVEISSGRKNVIGMFNPDELIGGNTNILKDELGYYSIGHRYYRGDRGRRTYANYIIRYDDSLCPVWISTPFKLCDEGIEFITTMLELPNGELLVGVTEMDDRPEIHIYDKNEFLGLVSKDKR